MPVLFLLKHRLLSMIAVLLLSLSALSQGDGPRTAFLAPKNVFGVDVKWLNLKQNLVPTGNIHIPGSDITVNVFPITPFYTFSLGGRFAQVYATLVPGSSKGTVNLEKFGLGIKSFTTSGLSDGAIGFKLGLIGAPALNAIAFSQKSNAYSMMAFIRIWYPGTFDQEKVMNMGTNRFALEVGLPMAIPIGKQKKFPYWLELTPTLEFYSVNHNPAPAKADISEARQMPLFAIENNLTKNINSKLWVGLGLRFQFGGSTIIDNEFDLNSQISALGFGGSMGFQILPSIGLKASYGDVLWGDNGLESRMIRINLVYTYINFKKLKEQ